MDAKSAERLEKVHPELKKRVTQLLFNLQNLGMNVRVVQGLRTFAEQDKLFNQPWDGKDNDGDGRIDEPDEKVTNAGGGQSRHNFGLATDLCPFTNGKADWNNTKAFQIIGREAKALGLEWGGDWKFKDRPHVQLRGMSVKECLQAFNSGGLNKVWSRMYELLGGAPLQTFIPAADDVLEVGDIGDEVAKLQKLLVELNLLHAHEVDGRFGKITKRAVIGFQRQNALTADGIVGPGTKAKIGAAIDAKRKAFANLSETEAESAVASLGFKLPDSSIISDKIAEQTGKFQEVLEEGQSAADETLNKTGSLVESMTEKIDTATGQIEKTITEKTDMFNPKNLPAFIPRFGKQWFLGLIPGVGFVSTILAKLAAMPDWLVFLLGFFTGMTIVLFVQMIIKYREKVVDFITKCYEITANPEMDNLIPTNAGEYVGNRKDVLLSALVKQ